MIEANLKRNIYVKECQENILISYKDSILENILFISSKEEFLNIVNNAIGCTFKFIYNKNFIGEDRPSNVKYIDYSIDDHLEFLYDSSNKKISIAKNIVKKKVLIIDDSKTIRKIIKHSLEDSEYYEVMGEAENPIDAMKIIKRTPPDIITLDINMPEMDGLTFLKTYKLNIPTIMVTAVDKESGGKVIECLKEGAVEYLHKPDTLERSLFKSALIEKLDIAKMYKKRDLTYLKKLKDFEYKEDSLILIGASTGGTEAIKRILHRLPKNNPPIVIVQHIPKYFSSAFAESLNNICDFNVKEAEDGDVLKSNNVYIAQGDTQLSIKNNKLIVDAAANKDTGHKPSVNYLFNSVGDIKCKNKMAILLTGMGKDGATGLLKLRESGFLTIAQDELSSVVYGMPKFAKEIGAAKEILSLDNIADRIYSFFKK